MESTSQDRNLPASERKLERAREDGQVTRSRDLSHLAVLGVGGLGILGLAPMMLQQLKLQMGRQLRFDAGVMTDPMDMLNRLGQMVGVGLIGCTVFAAIVSVAAVLSTLGAGGWVASLKPITPDFSRVNPLAGFGRLFTKDKLTETVKMTSTSPAIARPQARARAAEPSRCAWATRASPPKPSSALRAISARARACKAAPTSRKVV